MIKLHSKFQLTRESKSFINHDFVSSIIYYFLFSKFINSLMPSSEILILFPAFSRTFYTLPSEIPKSLVNWDKLRCMTALKKVPENHSRKSFSRAWKFSSPQSYPQSQFNNFSQCFHLNFMLFTPQDLRFISWWTEASLLKSHLTSREAIKTSLYFQSFAALISWGFNKSSQTRIKSNLNYVAAALREHRKKNSLIRKVIIFIVPLSSLLNFFKRKFVDVKVLWWL